MKIETKQNDKGVSILLNGTTHYEVYRPSAVSIWSVQESGYSGRERVDGYGQQIDAVHAALQFLVADMINEGWKDE